MSDAKFTPGPWSVDHHGYLVGKGGRKVVAYGVHASLAVASPSKEQRANGNLMNAAGSLYEALEGLLAHTPQAGDAAALLRYGKARTALAQARGEAL